MFQRFKRSRQPKIVTPTAVTDLDTSNLLIHPRIKILNFPDYWEVVEKDSIQDPGKWTNKHMTMGKYLLDSSDPDFICRNVSPMLKHMLYPFRKGSAIAVKGKEYEILDVWFWLGDITGNHWDLNEADGTSIPFHMELTVFVK